MRLVANAETIDRLVDQGALLLQAFHDEHKNGPTGPEAEFLRGELAGWRSTLYTEYHECAEQIVDRVRSQTGLTIPSCETSPAWLAPLDACHPVPGRIEWPAWTRLRGF